MLFHSAGLLPFFDISAACSSPFGLRILYQSRDDLAARLG
jgi:hypothetical protein